MVGTNTVPRKQSMISGVNTLSGSSISLLFGTGGTTGTTQTAAAGQLLVQVTGNTDDVFKAANAIGKIIEIVAGMNSSDKIFTMEGATRVDGQAGEYSLTKTGTGQFFSDAEFDKRSLAAAREQAIGTGPKAERARAYLDAMANGTIRTYDMSDMGVTSTMTQTNSYNSNGSDKGQSNSWSTKGINQFLGKYVVIKDDVMFDKATGKYAGISQNGTQFTYTVW